MTPETLIPILRALFAEKKWQLVAPDDPDFVARVMAQLREWHPDIDAGKPRLTDALIRRGGTNVYSEILYAVFADICAEQFDRAWVEVLQTVWPVLGRGMNWDEDLTADLAQETILQVAERLDKVKSPGTFISFTYWRARAVLKAHYRELARKAPLPPGGDGGGHAGPEDDPSEIPDKIPGPDDWYEMEEFRRQLRETIELCLSHNERQRRAFVGRFMDDLEYSELSRLLDATVQECYQLVSRALNWLRRDCARLHSLLRQYQGRLVDPVAAVAGGIQ